MPEFNINGISGLTLFTPTLYEDERGHNFESYDSLKFREEISFATEIATRRLKGFSECKNSTNISLNSRYE